MTLSQHVVIRYMIELQHVKLLGYQLPLNKSKVDPNEYEIVSKICDEFDEDNLYKFYKEINDLTDKEI